MTETIMTHAPCGEQVRSIIAGYVHLLGCPLAPPRIDPRRPGPVAIDDQPDLTLLIGRNPRHRVEPSDVTSSIRRLP